MAAFLAAGSFGIYDYVVRSDNEKAYEELAEQVKITQTPPLAEEPAVKPTAEPTVTPAVTTEPEKPKVEIPIDFEKLKSENPDIYAWIQIPGTEVDYPIVQSPTDDAYYLDHTVTGAKGYPGSIYTESFNSLDFSDKNTVLYGHNMKDGSMFGGLDKYIDISYMNEHSEIIIYTPEHKFTYQVFAAVTYDDRHILKSFDFGEEAGVQAFLDSVMSVEHIASQFSREIEATADDRLLTLSTCNGNSTQRFLVEAVLVNEE